jgi:hypothetical protein
MPISVSCWSCGTRLKAPEKLAGRKVKCPKCSQELTVPIADPDAPAVQIQAASPMASPLPAGAIQSESRPASEGPVPASEFQLVNEAGQTFAGFQYMRVYNYVFENANWATNLILGSLCALIPVVGVLTLIGYSLEVVEALHKKGDRQYPDFDFNRFGDYLGRGVWPFLLALIVVVPLCVIVLIINLMMALIFPPGLVVFFLFLMVMGLVVFSLFVRTPAVIRVGLSQRLDLVATFRFVVDFLQRMWVDLLVFELFLMASGMAVMIGGLLMCGIGVLPAVVLLQLASAHAFYQLYEVYLQRGGQPIPLKSGGT